MRPVNKSLRGSHHRSHRIYHSIAGAVAAAVPALIATSLIAAPAAHADPGADAVDVTSGSLVWGIKESWRKYISADGTAVEGGASWTDDGLFSFPLTSGSFDPETATTTLEFAGSVHFTGYCTDICLLDTRYGNLTVEIGPDAQVVRGDWSGRLQDDPAAGLESKVDVDLATLDIGAVALETDGAHTTWPAIPAAATADFVTYSAGTRLDPLTIEYDGPGGAPDLAERWDSPGAPVYDAGARWIGTSTESNARIAYPSADGDTIVIVEGATGEPGSRRHSIVAADATTLQPRGTALTVPEAGYEPMLRTAFDPATGSVFWPAAVDGAVQINRATWSASSQAFETSVIGRLPDSALAWGSAQLSAFAWNPVRSELAIASGTFSFADPQTNWTTIHSSPTGEWVQTDAELDLPAELRAQYEGSLDVSSPFGLNGVMPNLGVLSDGSYVLVGSGTVYTGPEDWSDLTMTPIPAFRIVSGGSGLDIEMIPGTQPDDRTYGAGYSFASTTAEGSVLLSSGTGAFRSVSIVDGDVTAGAEFVLDAGGGSIYSSGSVAADATTGLTLTTNVFAKKLVAFRGDAVVGTADVPLVNGTYPAPLTVGPDGSVYLPIRTGDGLGGIERHTLIGTVPAITAQPTPAVVDTASGPAVATFTVTATGTPAPAVQWQAKPAGQTTFTDVEGATASTLELEVTPTQDGTTYRAIVRSAAGAIASEPAGLTVLSAPVFEQHPATVTAEPGEAAAFQVLATANPEPTITWEQEVDGAWRIVSIDGVSATGSRLVMAAPSSSVRVRAVATNDHGTVVSDAAMLSVVTPLVHPDGSITGVSNAAGAATRVAPGVELASDGSATVSVTGSGFSRGTNTSGLYVLFGYVETFPSEGGSMSDGYAYLSGETNQRFVAWPDAGTAGAANAVFDADGGFRVDDLPVDPSFTVGADTIDCLDGSVRCGVFTIGAHGQRDAKLETFTPVYFVGQDAPPVPAGPDHETPAGETPGSGPALGSATGAAPAGDLAGTGVDPLGATLTASLLVLFGGTVAFWFHRRRIAGRAGRA